MDHVIADGAPESRNFILFTVGSNPRLVKLGCLEVHQWSRLCSVLTNNRTALFRLSCVVWFLFGPSLLTISSFCVFLQNGSQQARASLDVANPAIPATFYVLKQAWCL